MEKLSGIKKIRVLNGVTQQQLSNLLNVSQSYLSLLERDKREINEDIKMKIEEIFNVID